MYPGFGGARSVFRAMNSSHPQKKLRKTEFCMCASLYWVLQPVRISPGLKALSCRARFQEQVTVWFDEEGNEGAIAPSIIPAGTVTRRAVHKLWLTAINPKVFHMFLLFYFFAHVKNAVRSWTVRMLVLVVKPI